MRENERGKEKPITSTKTEICGGYSITADFEKPQNIFTFGLVSTY